MTRAGKLRQVLRSRPALVAVTSVMTLLLMGGIAIAAIPNSSTKVISGCYSTSGALRVIDRQGGATCAGDETLLEWNQKGQRGLPGIRWRNAWSSGNSYAVGDG